MTPDALLRIYSTRRRIEALMQAARLCVIREQLAKMRRLA